MSVWERLAPRYEGQENRPHKLLALDGGGIRGIITLEVLVRLEALLREATGSGEDFRLCQYFDYVAGTSTGAIIAAGLARGLSAEELLRFYLDTGPAMFDKESLLRRWRALYKSDPLQQELQKIFGEKTTLRPEHLHCLLLAVTRNQSTDSPWPISSNPQALFNDRALPDCNLDIPLWQLVRASTAAPVFFPPEVIQWDPTDESKAFVFVDGGVTPYNNPAFLLYRMATEPGFRLEWATGENRMLLVSIGTGAAAVLEEGVTSAERGLVSNVAALPGALLYAAMVDQDTCCRHVGRCVHGAPLDLELGDMIPRDASGERIPLSRDLGCKFLYARYNPDLSRRGLDALGLTDIEPAKVQRLDSIEFVEDLRRIGRQVGEEIRLEDLGPFAQ